MHIWWQETYPGKKKRPKGMSGEADIKAEDIPWQEKTAERYVRRCGYQGGRHTLARKNGGKVCLAKRESQQETYLREKKRRKGMSVEADIKAGDIPWQEKKAERYV